jgi:signal transduction histidine kinase
MKAPGVRAKDLPWLAPSAKALRALARFPVAVVWPQFRTDPGFVLLMARAWGRRARPTDHPACDIRALQTALHCLRTAPNAGFVDWSHPGAMAVYRTALGQARLAEALSKHIGDCDGQKAWTGGLLASLGWMAACAVGSRMRSIDPAGLGRRLSHAWRLPPWLTAVAGRLALPADHACRLGAQRSLFQIVQLSVLLRQREAARPSLIVGADLDELLAALRLDLADVERIAAQARTADVPESSWEAPAEQPLLIDLLELALPNRRRDQQTQAEQLHRDIDRLQQTLQTRRAEESRRLKALKLSALAEFAAGAGHEINNPLAVISGQAQYLLRQLELLDGPAEEIDNPAEYLANLKGPLVPSLKKIIAQTQRIHSLLTDLMQFARPAAPKVQAVDVAELMRDVAAALQALADERRVRLSCDTPVAPPVIHADPIQVRTSLTALLRNAIEAAPAEGWAGLRVERDAGAHVVLVIEDSGAGPGTVAQEHLFDPFFSGRSAGRGRGLGLPTAWRLACQQNGDVRFDGTENGVTRFSLVLPAPAAAPSHANGCNGAVQGSA